MTIRIWQQFSPNNSSSCRMVARFADPRGAREAAVEIATFLIEHIGEIRRRWIQSRSGDAFAAKYGFVAEELLEWTSELRPGDEPEIAIADGVLVVYHHYCQGFEHLGRMLQLKGASVEEPSYTSPPTISALFRSLRGDRGELDRALASVFAHIDHEGPRPAFDVPWLATPEAWERAAYFRDAGTVGLWMPCTPQALPAFEQWLANHGVERPSLRWCAADDEARFQAIAQARCTACQGGLEYLDPRIHDIETPQFVCRPCGGFYDLATYHREP